MPFEAPIPAATTPRLVPYVPILLSGHLKVLQTDRGPGHHEAPASAPSLDVLAEAGAVLVPV